MKRFYVLAGANVTFSILGLFLSILLVMIGLGAVSAVKGMMFFSLAMYFMLEV